MTPKTKYCLEISRLWKAKKLNMLENVGPKTQKMCNKFLEILDLGSISIEKHEMGF